MYKRIILKRAVKDLKNIAEYISSYSKPAAYKFLSDFREKVVCICENPNMYENYGANKNYKRAIIFDYLVFYRVFDEQKTIKIYRIIHGKRDLSKIIK